MKKQIRRRRRRQGFTLMEVLLVLVILVILGGMASVFIRGAQQNARLDAARSQLGLFESAIKMFELNNTRYPTSNEGLQALRTPQQYLDKDIPMDPWGNEYQYQSDGNTYSIWSLGPDRTDGTQDDIGVNG